MGQGKQSYIGGGRNPPPPQVENVLNRPGEIGLRDTCNSTPVSTSGTTSVTPSYSEGASGQEMQTHMDNSSSENQDVQQNQGTADNPISLDRDQFGEENSPRVNLRNDVISIFSDKGIFKYDLDVTFINQRGDPEEGKGQGLTREMLSSFWGEFYTSFSIGFKQKVPAIRHDFQSKEWEAVGRAFVLGLKYGFYFPAKVSTEVLTGCPFGENALTKDMLQDSFKAYV